MNKITNFYHFKYTRDSYYMELFIHRKALSNIEKSINERLLNIAMTKDEECAYKRLKGLFEEAREATDSSYIEVKINKCYIKYIKSLYYYFNDQTGYVALRVLNEYLQSFFIEDIDKISGFNRLNEDTRISILSQI